MYRIPIRLDTMHQIQDFVNIASTLNSSVYLVDDTGLKVSAKSIIGAMYTVEWSKIYVESDVDLGATFSEFRI